MISTEHDARKSIGVAVGLLVLLVAACYANSLNCALVWDDIPTIADSTSFEHFSTAFDRPAEVNTASGRPLLSLSLAINYAISKRSLLGFHLTNVLIHLVGTLALFGLVRRATLLPTLKDGFGRHATWMAFVVAALWAAHPLQTEAVTYVVQRAESMMGVAYLVTLYCFVRSTTSPRPWVWSTASVAACAAGMTSKEVMVSAPVIVLLFDTVFVSGSLLDAFRRRRTCYIALAGTWIVLAYLVISLGGNRAGSTGGFSTDARWLAYWASQFHAIAVYLKLMVFPHPLVFQYGPEWPSRVGEVLPYALVVTPLIAAAIYALFRKPQIGFLGLWFFSVLAPTSIIPGTSDMIVEHRMYLALAPAIALVVFTAYARFGRGSLWACATVTAVFAGVTVFRNFDYKTNISLWRDNTAKRPDFALGHYNLASVLLREPDGTPEAIEHLERAVQLLPGFPRAHFNLGIALSKYPERRYEACRHYEFALQLRPEFPEANNNLGVLYQDQGLLPQAIAQFRAALQSKPDLDEARRNLARALAAAGDTYGAVAEYSELLGRAGNPAAIAFECGSLLANTGHPAEAIPYLEKSLQLDPRATDARYVLGLILETTEGRAAEAVTLLQAVAKEKPGFAEIHFNLGNALAHFPERLGEAAVEFETATKLKPEYVEAHFNAAAALEAFPERRGDAIAHYRKFVQLEPRNPVGHFRLARLLALSLDTTDEARSEAAATLRLDPESTEARALFESLP